MPECAVLAGPRPKRGYGRLREYRFLQAYLSGSSLAEAAKAAGSRAVTDDALFHVGSRLYKRESIQAKIRDVQADWEAAWAGFASHAKDVTRGAVPGATEIDRLGNGVAAGRALGKFVERRETVHKHQVEIRGFPSLQGATLSPLPALPESLTDAALAAQIAALNAEVERRKNAATAPALQSGTGPNRS